MRKLIILFMCSAILFSVFGCKDKTKNKYNASIISESYTFNESFVMNNKTYGANLNGDWITDESTPKERVIIIDNESSFQTTFASYPNNVDFDKRIILLHGFTTAATCDYIIQNIELEAKNITIKYTNPKSNTNTAPNASSPDTKWLIVELDYIDINSAIFEFVG